MAVKTLLLELKWENANYFQLQAKLDDEDAVTICKVEENGCLASLWGSIQALCERYYKEQMDTIGKAMIG